jgi:hypothetical protein
VVEVGVGGLADGSGGGGEAEVEVEGGDEDEGVLLDPPLPGVLASAAPVPSAFLGAAADPDSVAVIVHASPPAGADAATPPARARVSATRDSLLI